MAMLMGTVTVDSLDAMMARWLEEVITRTGDISGTIACTRV